MLKISFAEQYGGIMIATRNIKKGEKISDLSQLPLIEKNNKYAITKTIGVYFDTTDHFGRFFNHSCEPNMTMNFENWCFYALKDIDESEMVTFNYFQTEYEMASPFDCLCGSKLCFGKIMGWKGLEEDKRTVARSIIPISPNFI
uniref:Histone-lysine N-methyltransferase, H3 lysine-4 specific (Trinotate prediction) n=1 Tax=Myxobolus squamalis TaxID=59785 RepID=A0A6B2GAC8_MYXSQ